MRIMKKRIMDLRDYAIHLLGGLTVDEAKESNLNCYGLGAYFAYCEMKHKMEKYAWDELGRLGEGGVGFCADESGRA